jgi:hypothetical protein
MAAHIAEKPTQLRPNSVIGGSPGDLAENERKNQNLAHHNQIVWVPEEAIRTSSHQRRIRQADDTGRERGTEQRQHPHATGLQKNEQSERNSIDRCRAGKQKRDGAKPRRMQQDDEGIVPRPALPRTVRDQLSRIVPRPHDFCEPQHRHCEDKAVSNGGHRSPITWNAAVNPGPIDVMRMR